VIQTMQSSLFYCKITLHVSGDTALHRLHSLNHVGLFINVSLGKFESKSLFSLFTILLARWSTVSSTSAPTFHSAHSVQILTKILKEII